MSEHVPQALRQFVAARARGLCEYCLIHDSDTFYGCQIEHIIARKHGGATVAENLAFACAFCNRAKGTDLTTLAPSTRQLTRLFNPREDRWADHFHLLETAAIEGRTQIGEATAWLLGFNHIDRILEPRALAAVDRFPTASARLKIGE